MKIWRGYGSDHSSNLVMIGEFKTEEDAQRVHELIKVLSENASADLSNGIFGAWSRNEQLSEETEKRLRDLQLYNLSPSDVSDFALWNPSIEKSGKTLRFRSDDVEIGGFVKLMVTEGAKVQVYSAHDYPEDDENGE
ncbi:MAG TPA: DUF6375 family protein [Planctomycetaceae bacterium]|jgi:hypothetical protein|nr:DUF6375 family protein [Planctomycetaceae bacterium]